MVEENKLILCKMCGNDKFVVTESILGAFYIGCAECGEGHIFGAGLSAKDIFFILKGEVGRDEKVI